jgi:hypothetical protein
VEGKGNVVENFSGKPRGYETVIKVGNPLESGKLLEKMGKLLEQCKKHWKSGENTPKVYNLLEKW